MKTYNVTMEATAYAFLSIRAESAEQAQKLAESFDDIGWDEMGGWDVANVEEADDDQADE